MKLSNYLTIRLSVISILILLVWSVVYFFIQMNEIYDGIDEGLNNLKQEFVLQANETPEFIENMEKYNPLNMVVEKIPYEEALNFKEEYSTTTVYFTTEEEDEEVRMLTTVFQCEQNREYYKLKFFTSTVESNDMVKNILYLQIALWVCLGLALIFVSKKVINKTNKPFYKLLSELREFQLDNTRMIDLQPTNIDEYKELNQVIEKLLKDNINTYTEQKNFIENASHELQTPLAVTINKLELYLQEQQLSQSQIEEIGTVLNNLNRMKRLNSSLLLLSKIKNRQYPDIKDIDLNGIFTETLENFKELIDHKSIILFINDNGHFIVKMNMDLAYIMVNNLIKNAVSHNIEGGKIEISFSPERIIVINDGKPPKINKDIFERYIYSANNKQSLGLGLSIVKSIVDIFDLNITYNYSNKHIITLSHNKSI